MKCVANTQDDIRCGREGAGRLISEDYGVTQLKRGQILNMEQTINAADSTIFVNLDDAKIR